MLWHYYQEPWFIEVLYWCGITDSCGVPVWCWLMLLCRNFPGTSRLATQQTTRCRRRCWCCLIFLFDGLITYTEITMRSNWIATRDTTFTHTSQWQFCGPQFWSVVIMWHYQDLSCGTWSYGITKRCGVVMMWRHHQRLRCDDDFMHRTELWSGNSVVAWTEAMLWYVSDVVAWPGSCVVVMW